MRAICHRKASKSKKSCLEAGKKFFLVLTCDFLDDIISMANYDFHSARAVFLQNFVKLYKNKNSDGGMYA